MSGRKWLRVEPIDVIHAIRTAFAAVASLLLARLCKLPEAYWAAITTMIVMQSTLGAALNVSKQRLIGTALGAAMAALLATYVGTTVAIYGVGILACGLICALLHLERLALRYAGITLTIILLVTNPHTAWVIAVHRFVEISLGIVTGLILTMAWPEPQSASKLS